MPVTFWVSGSMGGATSLNAMVHGVAPPPCWYGVKPAVALTDMEEVPGRPENIAEAFDGPVPTDRNPIENVDLLPWRPATAWCRPSTTSGSSTTRTAAA